MENTSTNLDPPSDISPSAPSIPSTPESSVSSTTNSSNVTPTSWVIFHSTLSKRPRSYISETTSSLLLHRPPITEITINTRLQQTPIDTPIIHIPNTESVEQYVTYKYKHPTAIKTVRLHPQLNIVQIPDTEYTKLPSLKLPSELSTTSSKFYPPLKLLRKPSTLLSNLLDKTSDYAPSQDTSSLFVPKHRYNLRDLPSRRLRTDTSTLNFSALSSNSALRLVRQHAHPLSSDTPSSEIFQSPYFTSGFETASLLSSNPQTAFLSGDLFSQVVIPTPVPAHIRLPEYYTAEHSRPPTPNLADYPLRVDGITIYDPQNKTTPDFQFLQNVSIITTTSYLTNAKKQN